MTVKELAEYLFRSRRSIYRHIKDGTGPPAIRINSKIIRFEKEKVAKWLNSRMLNPAILEPDISA